MLLFFHLTLLLFWYVLFCIIFFLYLLFGFWASKKPGGRFSKAPETFRARKAIAKSQTWRLQSCEINKF